MQATVSRSSVEVEYRSMAFVTSELIWVKGFLTSIGIFHTQPISFWCDSQATIHIANNPVFYEKTKYTEIDCHFVREKLDAKTIQLCKTHTKQQPADLFTKALGQAQFQFFKSKLDILDLHAPT